MHAIVHHETMPKPESRSEHALAHKFARPARPTRSDRLSARGERSYRVLLAPGAPSATNKPRSHALGVLRSTIGASRGGRLPGRKH